MEEENNGTLQHAMQNCTELVLKYEPSLNELFEILDLSGWLLLAFSSMAMFFLVSLFLDTVIHILKFTQARHKFSTATVISVYPVLGLCSYLGILFPKSNLMLDAAGQLYFGLCMWQFLSLTFSYFGGEQRFVQIQGNTVLPWRGLPCCWWPCCWPCFPKAPVNKNQVKFLKACVLQHPFVQIIMTIIGVPLWIEGLLVPGKYSYDNSFVYVYVITITSFLFALWAFIVGFKSSFRQLQDFHYLGKIISFQLCLIFLKFQAIIVNMILVPSGAIPCLPPISPMVYANIILCALLLGQLVILSVVARHFYKLPMPEIVPFPDPASTNAPLIITSNSDEKDVNVFDAILVNKTIFTYPEDGLIVQNGIEQLKDRYITKN